MIELGLISLGLGMVFQGALIIWVAGMPQTLMPGEAPKAEKGTPEAFGLFWIEQYRYIGLVLLLVGVALAVWGYLR